MKIKIIYAKSDEKNKPLMIMPYLGIFALGESLKSLGCIECIDQNIEDTPIESFGDYTCLSINSFNFRNSKKIIKRAKENGSVTICGGIHPTHTGVKMLCEDQNIDYVIAGKGDVSLPKLIKNLSEGKGIQDIPGIIYRTEDKVIKTKPKFVSINSVLINYESMMKREIRDPKFGKVLPYLSQCGCKGSCFFCSCPDKKTAQRPPLEVWSALKKLCLTYNPDIIRDNTDDFLTNPAWVRALAQSKPECFNYPWFGYIRGDRITEDTVRDLVKIGFKYVYLGLESGDDVLLKRFNKGLTTEDNFRATKILSNHGINITGTIVLGAPGETTKSLKKTLEYCKRLHKLGNITSLSANILIPYIGTQAFRYTIEMLEKNEEFEKSKEYNSRAYIPLEELQKTYLRLACPSVKIQILREYRDKINKLAPTEIISVL